MSFLYIGAVALIVKSLDTSDPQLVFNLQAGFLVVHTALLAVLLFIRIRIFLNPNTQAISVREDEDQPKFFPVPAEEEAKAKRNLVSMSITAYDVKHWTNYFLLRFCVPVLIMAFVAYKWGAVVPLAIQSVHNPYQLYQHQLFKIHILGQPAKFELARPWVIDNTPGFLKAWADRAQQQPTKKVIVMKPTGGRR